MNPMRSVLLAMAGSPTWRRLLTGWGVTRRVVGRFIPGESLDEAATAVGQLAEAGFKATMNPLGENVNTLADAERATDAYVRIVERIAAERLPSGLSVKLTMLGLDLGEHVASANLRRLLRAAAATGAFVRVDMESSTYVDRTLAIVEAAHAEFPRIGAVLQSYLRRTPADLDRLISHGISVRLVKGAYAEAAAVAYPDKRDVDAAFAHLLDRLAMDDARHVDVAIASHDAALVRHARQLIDEHGLRNWEFQMLYGIGRDLQQQLLGDGYPVRVYVSYGPSWYPWFMRRLAERPANVLFFLRHLLG